ncbi:hypothetical protein KW842_19425 [Duganella sp. sic0402]|uniref:hypothetical protein n=1 Tax=Duganella sp. sic0402 TaxID=2854786 RepID=UPI001C44D1E6|nr:hypothetical protein [Duganella sp. sic0402]MBV7537947.1 hypothetical protein [Duganella sp. sic0402]
MKLTYLPLLAALCVPACYASTETTSVKIDDTQSVGKIQGSSGVITVNGDKVELLNRVVYVNGVSYGPVPKVADIKYVVTKKDKTLYVDGKPRQAASKP